MIKNKNFIEDQTRKTVYALTRDRLYSRYGQEIEREMMAHNREQFGFKGIESTRVMDRKSHPKRGLATLGTFLIAGIILSIYFCVRDRNKNSE